MISKTTVTTPKNEYYVCEDFETSKYMLEGILKKKFPAVAVDLETTSLDEFTGKILGIGLSWKRHTAFYIPFNTREIGLFTSELEVRWSDEEEEILIDLIRQIMIEPKIKIIAHNASFEIKWLKEHWNAEPVNIFCTFWYRFIQHPDTSKGYEERLSLGHIIAEKYPDLIHLKDIWAGIGKNDSHDLSLYHSTEKIGDYCCGDSDACFREYLHDQEDIKGKPFEKLVPRRLMPAVNFVARMSSVGFPVDIDYLHRTRKKLKVEESDLLAKIQEIAKSLQFNPKSSHHLEKLFIRELKLPKSEVQRFDVRQKKMIKALSFDDLVLSTYQEQYGCKIAGQILDYRRVSKLISTYFDGVEKLINPVTGRVHADLKLWGTVTGRLSCTNPPLQTLPVRDIRSRIVKNMFVAPDGYVIIGADYSQIELRLLAFYSQDPLLLDAYLNGKDLHKVTASLLFGIPEDQITKEQRYIGKTSNFALCYGAKAGVLIYGSNGIGNKIMGPEYAEQIGVSYEGLVNVKIHRELLMQKAREFRGKFLEGYSGLMPYMRQVVIEARKIEYVVTDYGRVRYLPGINSNTKETREHWERCAVNTRPQGTATDYQMFHFMDMISEFDFRRWGVEPCLSVHDQCVMFVPEDKVDIVEPLIPELGIRADEANIGIEMKLEPVRGMHLGEV